MPGIGVAYTEKRESGIHLKAINMKSAGKPESVPIRSA